MLYIHEQKSEDIYVYVEEREVCEKRAIYREGVK